MKNKYIFLTITFLTATGALIGLGAAAAFMADDDVVQTGRTYQMSCPYGHGSNSAFNFYLRAYDENGSLKSPEIKIPQISNATGCITMNWLVRPFFSGDASPYKWKLYFTSIDGSREAVEDIYFRRIVNTAPLKVVYPDRQETLDIGKTYQIRWSQAGLSDNYNQVLLSLERYDSSGTRIGVDLLNSYMGTPAINGNYSWTIPPNFSSSSSYQYKILATRLVYPPSRSGYPGRQVIEDRSDNFFRIITPPQSIRVGSPNNAGIELDYYSPNTISWTQTSMSASDLVDIFLAAYKLDGAFIKNYPLKYGVSATLGRNNWTPINLVSQGLLLTNPVNEKYKILIKKRSAAGLPIVQDYSDYFFGIFANPKIRIISPNGGERCLIGDLCQIKFESWRVNNVSIWLYDEIVNPPVVEMITSGYKVSGRQSIFPWVVPYGFPASNKFKIEVVQSDSAKYPGFDKSDAHFSFVQPLAQSQNFFQKMMASILNAFQNFLHLFKK